MPVDAPVLVTSTRCGVIETRFRGAVVLVDAAGNPIFSLGDTSARTFPRSAIKLVQVLPVLQSGAVARFGLTSEEVAVMCASHNGEPRHLAAVRSILAKAGVPESALRCGALPPLGAGAFEALCRGGGAVSPLHNNCSGKHAGFLAACVANGWDLETYLRPEHPLQAAIRAEVAHFAELPEGELLRGVDGCSAPNYAMSVLALARLFKNLALPQAAPRREAARAAMLAAVAAAPFFLGGTGRYCSELSAACPRCVGKLGAEGVYGCALLDRGWGVACKIECGALGPQYSVAQAVLEGAGALRGSAAAALARFLSEPVLTARGDAVGTREALPALREGVAAAVAGGAWAQLPANAVAEGGQ
jgi:L-asparaginase II